MRWSSSATVMGMPLISVANGPDAEKGEARGLARGLIAVGDTAIGVIAVGGASIGGIAVGGASVGVISLGGASVGVVAIGGAAGLFAQGGVGVSLLKLFSLVPF